MVCGGFVKVSIEGGILGGRGDWYMYVGGRGGY